MKNYKFTLQYEGTRYRGWQRQQSTENTIQGKLEAVLSKMCGEPVEVAGAGRTDAGVHAFAQVANAHLNTKKTPSEVMEYLNAYLPEDIGITGAEEVGARFHSRLNAKGKTYCYRVLNSAVPHIFDRRYVYAEAAPLDLEAMRIAAGQLAGTHDFKSFTSAKRGACALRKGKSTVRTVTRIAVERVGDEIRFTYEGNGFLYHMARILTGTLLEVGLGARSADSMEALIQAGDREQAGFLAPAVGLMLMEVRYDGKQG